MNYNAIRRKTPEVKICKVAIDMMKPYTGTFKVAARRSDKKFPMDSMQLGREIGHHVLQACPAQEQSIDPG